MNWKFYLMIAAGPLEMVSKLLKNQDANDVGTDDKAAAFLHYASLGIQAIINDQPLPTVPNTLASNPTQPLS